MKPEQDRPEVPLATTWPEPFSLVFSVEEGARDVDTEKIIRAVIEQNKGEWMEEIDDRQKGGESRSVEPDSGELSPAVYRAVFPERTTVDAMVKTFEAVDRDLSRELGETRGEPAVLRQVNWFTGGAPEPPWGGSGGGPGARPAPFKMEAFPAMPLPFPSLPEGTGDGTTVRLVIFDAWNRDDAEARRLQEGRGPGGPLLYGLNGFPNENRFDPALDQLGASRDNDPFPVPDHGLFVASTAAAAAGGWEHFALAPTLLERIRDRRTKERLAELKGGIELESVRVLGEYGVGDTYQLVWHLERLAASIRPDEKVVVNLSLVVNTPPVKVALRRLFDGNKKRGPDALHAALHSAIRKLHKAGALVVAAAGNSSSGEAARQRALYPAAFDEVLAVTAATPDGSKEAYYANRVFSKGVAVFGGTVKRDPSTGKIVVDEKFPLVGPFTDSKVPLYGEDPPNESGMVLWAGTSFATPRVAALAARLWLADPSLSNDQVVEQVKEKATGALQCGTPYIRLEN